MKYKWDNKILKRKPIPVRIGQFRRLQKSNKIVNIRGISNIDPNWLFVDKGRVINKKAINPYKIVK